jgi:hypothetical protein
MEVEAISNPCGRCRLSRNRGHHRMRTLMRMFCATHPRVTACVRPTIPNLAAV